MEQALEIVQHQISIGTRFHYIAADGLYGNSYWFQDQLDKLHLLFVLDVHREIRKRHEQSAYKPKSNTS